jgi:hypothetical protein
MTDQAPKIEVINTVSAPDTKPAVLSPQAAVEARKTQEGKILVTADWLADQLIQVYGSDAALSKEFRDEMKNALRSSLQVTEQTPVGKQKLSEAVNKWGTLPQTEMTSPIVAPQVAEPLQAEQPAQVNMISSEPQVSSPAIPQESTPVQSPVEVVSAAPTENVTAKEEAARAKIIEYLNKSGFPDAAFLLQQRSTKRSAQ